MEITSFSPFKETLIESGRALSEWINLKDSILVIDEVELRRALRKMKWIFSRQVVTLFDFCEPLEIWRWWRVNDPAEPVADAEQLAKWNALSSHFAERPFESWRRLVLRRRVFHFAKAAPPQRPKTVPVILLFFSFTWKICRTIFWRVTGARQALSSGPLFIFIHHQKWALLTKESPLVLPVFAHWHHQAGAWLSIAYFGALNVQRVC